LLSEFQHQKRTLNPMASKKLTTLVVELQASTKELEKNLKETNKKIAKWHRRGGAGFSKSFLKGFAPAAVGAAIAGAISSAVMEGAKIQASADKLGITTDALQELQFAGRQVEVSSDTTAMAIQRFSRRVGEAAVGTGELKGVLEEYNISVKNSDGSTRDTMAVLGDFAEALSTAGGDTEQLRMAMKAFDSEGVAFKQVLAGGREGLNQFRQEAHDAGNVIDTVAVYNLSRFKKAAESALISVKALSASIVGGVMGAFPDDEMPPPVRLQQIKNELIEIEEEIAEARGLAEKEIPNMARSRAQRVANARQERLAVAKEQKKQLVNEQKTLSEGIAAAARKASLAQEVASAGNVIANNQLITEEKLNKTLKEEIKNLDSQFERYRELAKMKDGLKLTDEEMTEAYQQMLKELTKNHEAAVNKLKDDLTPAQEAWESLNSEIKDGLANALLEGEVNIRGFIKNILKQFAAAQIEAAVLSPIFSFLDGLNPLAFLGPKKASPHAFGSTRQTTGALDLPFFQPGAAAGGGRIQGGQPYIVGELGPELVVPNASSMVIPNNRLGGVGGDNVVVNQTLNFSTDLIEVQRQIAGAAPAIASATERAILDKRLRGRVA